MAAEPRDWDLRGDELAAEHIARGEATARFDRLYADGVAGAVSMPWDRTEPHPLLREWAEREGLAGAGLRAVVVGCDLGADAAYLADLGFETVGFDVAPTAIEIARERFAGTGVDFRVADLLSLPPEWSGAFDLVVEIFTIQALPEPPRSAAMAAIRGFVAPAGTLLAVAFRSDGTGPADQGPPFPLTEETMRALAGDQLEVVALEPLELPAGARWRVEYRRAA